LDFRLSQALRRTPAEIHGKVKIWPNPAGNYLRIGITEHPYSSSAYISIIDLAGHELMKVPFAEEIDISRLTKGYLHGNHRRQRENGSDSTDL
jgi:hypothetical protein